MSEPHGRRDRLVLGNYRDDVWMVPGHGAATRRLVTHQGQVHAAFNSLDIQGFDFEALESFLEQPVHAMLGHPAIKGDHARLADLYGRFVGMAAAVAMTAVEADRQQRED